MAAKMGDAHVTVETTASELTFYPGAAMAWQALTDLTYESASDLIVWRLDAGGVPTTLLARDIDYAVTGNGEIAQGQIKALSARPTSEQWLIRRETQLTQSRAYPAHQPFPSSATGKAFDKLTRIVQELKRGIAAITSRALLAPEGETLGTLPNRFARANKLQGYDGFGAPALYPQGVVDPALWQRFNGAYADAVLASEYGSVEAAHTAAVLAGKKRVVVPGLAWVANGTVTTFTLPIEFIGGATCRANGFALTLAAGFRAGDYDNLFLPSDAGRLTFPVWQRLTPFHFGAKGDYVSSASPGTDDGDALNAWAAELCWRVMPPAVFGTTKTIFLNGDLPASAKYGIFAEAGAEIVQRTDNIPVMAFYGARGTWRFPKLSFMVQQPNTNRSAIGLLCATNPTGPGNGFYMANVPHLHVNQAAIGVFFPKAINSTAAEAAAAGSNTVKVAHAQTIANGGYPWVTGMYVQIYLDNGTYHTTRITGVATDVLTLRDPIPAGRNVAIGNRVAVSPSVLVGAGATGASPVRFSNTWSYVFIENPSQFGWVCTGTGTNDVFLNRYINFQPAPIQWQQVPQAVSAIWEENRNGDKHVMTNIEHFNFSSHGWYVNADSVDLGFIHFEANRMKSNATGLIAGPTRNLSVDTVQVTYCAFLSEDLAGSTAGIFCPTAASDATRLGANKGTWRVGCLDTYKNFVSPGVGFIVREASNNQIRVRFESWQLFRDGGFYPTGQLTSSINWSPVIPKNLMPENTVAYLLDADLTITTVQSMFPSNKGQYRVSKLAYMWPSKTPTTATAGVFDDEAATTLVSSANNTALSGLTSKTGTIIEPGLAAGEANKLRAAGFRIYFKCNAAEAAPASVTGASSYLTGRNGGSGNTNLGFINFGAAHGFNAGDVVTITGSVTAALNSTFKIVDVPSATQIAVYVDSAAAVGSAGAPTADAAIAVRLKPTINVFALGDDYGF